MNRVIIVGRLAADPEERLLPNGSKVSKIPLAYNRKYKGKDGQWKEDTSYFSVEVYNRMADYLKERGISKGDLVIVEGELRQDRWEDENKNKREKVKIVAISIKRLMVSNKSDTAPKKEDNPPVIENIIENIHEDDDDDLPW